MSSSNHVNYAEVGVSTTSSFKLQIHPCLLRHYSVNIPDWVNEPNAKWWSNGEIDDEGTLHLEWNGYDEARNHLSTNYCKWCPK